MSQADIAFARLLLTSLLGYPSAMYEVLVHRPSVALFPSTTSTLVDCKLCRHFVMALRISLKLFYFGYLHSK